MEIKVALPNPESMSMDMFLAQMRIALKAFEKSYQEATKNLTEEEKTNGDYWISFDHPLVDNALIETKENIDNDLVLIQNIELCLKSL